MRDQNRKRNRCDNSRDVIGPAPQGHGSGGAIGRCAHNRKVHSEPGEGTAVGQALMRKREPALLKVGHNRAGNSGEQDKDRDAAHERWQQRAPCHVSREGPGGHARKGTA